MKNAEKVTNILLALSSDAALQREEAKSALAASQLYRLLKSSKFILRESQCERDWA